MKKKLEIASPKPSRAVAAVKLDQTTDDLRMIVQVRTDNDQMSASPLEGLPGANPRAASTKEELQERNEKLSALNTQLQAKIEELESGTYDMSSLLSGADIAVVFLDLQLRIRRHTPAVGNLIKLTANDHGRRLDEITLRFTDPTLLRDAQLVLANHMPIENEVVSDIGRTYIRRALPCRTIDHRLNGVALTFVDITQRKQAEMALRANEAQYRQILEGIREYAIFLLDREGLIASWAAGAERILGYSENEALGQHLRLIHTAEDRAAGKADEELGEAERNNTVFVERWHIRKDGSKFWGTGTLSALHDGAGLFYGFVQVVRDNTDRKFSEEALKQAKRHAEDANASKDYFLANVSHELRTPLATIMLWTQLLKTKGNHDPAFLLEGLETIDTSTKEQQALIEDLMDTSKIVAGKLRLEYSETNLNQLIRDTVTAINPPATQKGLALKAVLDPEVGVVRADPRRLRQVLTNVLNNAVKFTASGGHISVRSERIGNIVEIHVSDTGQGISPEFISKVFDRYMQADQANVPSAGGMGLGLAIARQLVESHSGTIRAQSDGLDKGTVFSIRIHLPRIYPDPAPWAPVDSPASHATLTGLRILLVEDAPSTRKALTTLLIQAGARVTAVDAAATALSAFDEERPDLILSDIGLGKVSGHDLIKQIRAREAFPQSRVVPAVALTAYADEKNRRKALECGFQACLAKPVQANLLLETLAALHSKR